MKTPKISNKSNKKAEQAAAEAQAAANNLQANLASDLKTENMAQVIAGGTADTAGAQVSDALRKKRPTGSLSSSLGINA